MGRTGKRKRGDWKRSALPWVLIVLASALAHLWCLKSQFFLDDVLQIRDNSELRAGSWQVVLFLRWTYFCYWVQTKLWWMSPVGFHAVNWLLHTSVALVLYRFGRDCLAGPGAARVALCGALLFAVHPLGSEIPNYARTQDLAWVTLFSLTAAWLAVRCMREFRWPLLAGLLVCIAGATLSKGPGLFHAVMMVAFAVAGCAPAEFGRFLKHRWKVLVAVAGAMAAVLWMSGLFGTLAARLERSVGYEGFGWHAVTLCRVFWNFVALLLFPRDLSSDHFIAATLSWEDGQAVAAVAGVVLWVIVATVLMFRSSTRFVGMCLWLFVGAILMRTLYFINEFMPEYRIYPGLPWICLGVVVVAWAGWRRLTKVSPGGLMGFLVLVLCVVSGLRSTRWHNLDDLCGDTLELYPYHGRALWIVQRRDADLERWDAIIRRHQRFPAISRAFEQEARRIAPGRYLSRGHHIMATVACIGHYAEALAATGRGDEALGLMAQSEDYLRRTNSFDEESQVIVEVHYHSLGRVHERRGEYEKALEALAKTNGKNHREVDIKRVSRKLSEARGAEAGR